MEDDRLTEPEVLLIIEALDAFIPEQGNNSWQGGRQLTQEEVERFAPFDALRQRLKSHAGLGFYDRARSWLRMALREERVGFSDALLGRTRALLEQPGINRRQLRAGVSAAIQELRDVQFFRPRHLTDKRL